MDKRDLLSLAEELGGDEHEWVDFKQDYFVSGDGYHTAEFIKDVASFANTVSGEDLHYIFIGFTESGELVGIDEDELEYSGDGRRHILSCDVADLRQDLSEHLIPTPDFSLHTFDEDGSQFAALCIKPLEQPPCVTSRKVHDNSGNRVMHKGAVYTRKSGGKKIIGRDDLEKIVRHRIELERDYVTEGLRRVVDIGPDKLAEIGTLKPNQTGNVDISYTVSEQGDYEVTQATVTRDEFSSLEEELNSEIRKWKRRDSYLADFETLIDYYTNPSEITIDETSAKFLTLSSMDNWIPGIFWLNQVSETSQSEIVSEVVSEDMYPSIYSACKVLLLQGQTDQLNEILDISDSISTYQMDCGKYRELVDEQIDPRCDYLFKDSYKNLKYNDWEFQISPAEMSTGDIVSAIPSVSEQLLAVVENGESSKKSDLKYGLVNLEIELAREIFDDSS